MSRRFQFSLKTLLRLAVTCISFAGTITRSSGEEDAGSSATPPAAQEKVLPDSEADGRLRDALKDTAVDLLEMVPITGGSYTMGSPLDMGLAGFLPSMIVESPSFINQGPEHEVTVDGFYLGKYEVTVEQIVFFLNAIEAKDERYLFLHPHSPVRRDGDRWTWEEGAAHLAADTVIWQGAKAFCKWLSETTGDRYRLPTEAEWEWAARGKEGRLYPWGVTVTELPTDDEQAKKLDAEVRQRADWGPSVFRQLANPNWKRRPVGSFPNGATPDGLCDMVGGVWEWCEDRYALRYDASQTRNPKGPAVSLAGRVMRGGQENVGGGFTETTTRLSASPDCHRDARIYGCRLLREVRARSSADDDE
ncbi:MAG TPA: SUMF1/EgtB/PvdO family nonheme iron enzyme [Pirellulales bacterium]|nr:SUMF1/EgtB/PvdO family nonheme iron enzyme [Pirellulales bacterium]